MTAYVRSYAAVRRDRLQYGIWYLTVAIAAGLTAWFLTFLDWPVVLRSWPIMWRGLQVSFALTAVSVLGGLILGAALAAMRLSPLRPARYLSLAFIETVRATPQLMVIFWIYLSYPALTGHAINSWIGAAVALTLIAAAFLAEVIRGGLLSIPRVQRESSTLLGLSRTQAFLFILLPQACRNMLPALIATVIMMFKTTSLVFVIGLIDFFRAVMIINNREFAPLTLYTVLALVYFFCCYALSSLLRSVDPKYTITSG